MASDWRVRGAALASVLVRVSSTLKPEVAGHAAVQHELDRLGRAEGLGRRLGRFAHHQALDLEAGGVGVGDVVRDDVELAAQRHLTRQADIEGVVHGDVYAWACATLSYAKTLQALGQSETSMKTTNNKVNGRPSAEIAGYDLDRVNRS